MSITRIFIILSGILGMSGVLITAIEFDPDTPWFSVGLLCISIACLCGVGACLSFHRTRIIAAFDVGFQAGYRKGRRIGTPKVINLRQHSRK